ncbi:hypothetical protein GOC53_05475 [Sinorhizobium medicae]|nr:hypothetical protein [Sinorhizobium medicae]MDX0539646.1 hypothetical protein [Sinorhizobium medicae]
MKTFDDSVSTIDWLSKAQVECAAAIKFAMGADRAALLRSLIRLNNGRLDLERAKFDVSNVELAELARFGIEISGSIARLVDESGWSPEWKLFRPLTDLDSEARRGDENCPPDAVLLRHTARNCTTQF